MRESISKIRQFDQTQKKDSKTIKRGLKILKNTVKGIIRKEITGSQYRRTHQRDL